MKLFNHYYLISYSCTTKFGTTHCCKITSDPMGWIVETQKYEDETYILLNVLKISKKLAKKYNGALKGM